MQFAKDSFSMALRERLAALNPARVVTVSGASRPAVVVVENELPNASEPLTECFYLEWGGVRGAEAGSGSRLCAMDCTITYRTLGSVESRVDRGRVLGELDRELFMICQPTFTGKRDFSQAPITGMGTGVSWTLPVIEKAKPSSPEAERDPAVVEHQARVTVYFFPEVESL